jgi:hypothetical protein
MAERAYFTEDQACTLVGKRIKTLVAWSGVPARCTGQVTRADPGRDGWTVAITWELPRDPVQVGVGQVGGEPFLFVSGGKPLTDWFSRDEFERWIEVVGDAD